MFKFWMDAGQRQVDFFLHIAILFHQCNNKNVIYQQFFCCLHYIFYTWFILLCFDMFSLPASPEKLHFGLQEFIFSHSF